MRKLILFLSAAILHLCTAYPLIAQFNFDFETPETTPVFEAIEAAVVENPDTVGNSSKTCVYYKRPTGNWHYFSFPFEEELNIGDNDRVSFKVRTSTSGRIFIKFWNGSDIPLQSWVREYNYRPTSDEWTELTYDVSSIKNQNITKLEIAASVDNPATADIYYDDIRLYKSAAPNGEPIIVLEEFTSSVLLGNLLELNASNSNDVNGEITSYFWDLGDGTIIENESNIRHQYLATGLYKVLLTITDNEGNSSTREIQVWVYPQDTQVSPFFKTTKDYATNEKIELSFLTLKNYENPFDSDEVAINAIITQPDGKQMTVPCFFYQHVTNESGVWMRKQESCWKLRWSTNQVGVHQVQLEVVEGQEKLLGETQTFQVSLGISKGIIQPVPNNLQYYQHTTGESYFPFGINAGWDDISNYNKLISNLGNGKANWIRYWHAAFTNQAIEWKDGLNQYSAVAAAKQDSIIELCRQNEVYLQMCIFHHGMFSHTINSNWNNSPYNQRNDGPLTEGEQFFYDETAKRQTKKLLRYIVARWGYSPELFAWELFNEVQWTGRHPNQSDKWKEAVIEWHDEMGQYIKSLDAFDHIITTSADDNQLIALAEKEGIDVIQYHTYPGTNLNNNLLQKDANFLSKASQKSIICGEYGYQGDGDVPYDEQRLAIWSSVFSRVPHMIWRWEVHYQTRWTDLFKVPVSFIEQEGLSYQDEFQNWSTAASADIGLLRTSGFIKNNQQAYALIYDDRLQDNIQNASIDLSQLRFGNYQIETIDITTQEINQEENVMVTFQTTSHPLPSFSDGLIVKATYIDALNILLAYAGKDQTIGLGQDLFLSAISSISPESTPVNYQWDLLEQPEESMLDISDQSTNLEINLLPETPGNYQFLFSIIDSITSQTSTDTIQVFVSDNPVALAGEDERIELGERPNLSGRSSYDPDGDRITYSWSIVARPDSSIAELRFPNSSRPIFDPDVDGLYQFSLIVSDEYSSSQPDTVSIQVGMITSVVELWHGREVAVFPNPVETGTTLTIQVTPSSSSNPFEISLFNLTGQIILTKKSNLYQVQGLTVELPTHLVSGFYWVHISNGNDRWLSPIVIK